MGAIKRKKLAFLANFSASSTAAVRTFPCTAFRSTNSYTGDMFGCVMEDLAPLTVGSNPALMQRNNVQLWTRVLSDRAHTSGVAYTSYFCSATTNAANATILQTQDLKTLNPITGAATTLGSDGITPVMTRHFGIMVKRAATNASSAQIMVYAARQHSLEA